MYQTTLSFPRLDIPLTKITLVRYQVIYTLSKQICWLNLVPSPLSLSCKNLVSSILLSITALQASSSKHYSFLFVLQLEAHKLELLERRANGIPVKIYAKRVFKKSDRYTSWGIQLNKLDPQEEIILIFGASQGLNPHQDNNGNWKMEKISMRSATGCVVLGLFSSEIFEAEQSVLLGFGNSWKDAKIYKDLKASAAHNHLEAINEVVKRLRNLDRVTFQEIDSHDGTTNVWDDLYLAMMNPALYKQKVEDLSGDKKGLIWNVEKLLAKSRS
ncbi:hypothetical protein LENED_011022 [Lentinula edodes]|uniref:Uncharacterized protein n=1 Tax=Lentinula edodes TaxID=5353 RepID=A0A1Q3ENZ1_LENED|nr:hypothetical protein LENED_011022 [Lentinula edodes]